MSSLKFCRGCFAAFFCSALLCSSSAAFAQQGESALQQYFSGKEVTVKLDMPGTQKGADINVGQGGLNWKDYGNRIKEFGVAIPKGATSRVTAVIVKKDRIEFQLDGGGFGTFGDDSNTHVLARTTPKSDYEKDLERQISNTTDADRRARLQRDLDRERARREREDQNNRRAAQIASQIKSQQVMANRAQGGSRFNLRWAGKVPADELTPQAVMAVLAPYVDFDVAGEHAAAANADAPSQAAYPPPGGPMQIQNGMTMDQVSAMLGPGHVYSQHVDQNGLNTVEMDYGQSDRAYHVTFVNGVVVRYSMQSH